MNDFVFKKLIEKRRDWNDRLIKSRQILDETIHNAKEAYIERNEYILVELEKVNNKIKEICPHTDTREKFLDYWRNNTIYKRYCNVCNKVIGQLTINDKEGTEEYEEL